MVLNLLKLEIEEQFGDEGDLRGTETLVKLTIRNLTRRYGFLQTCFIGSTCLFQSLFLSTKRI